MKYGLRYGVDTCARQGIIETHILPLNGIPMATTPSDVSAANERCGIFLQRVSKSYNTVRALNDITLHFSNARTTAIVGTSGCGKSTLLKTVNGLVIPDSGQLLVNGETFTPANQLRLRRRMGYCVQHIGLFPHLTLKDNITLLAKLEKQSPEKINTRLQLLLSTCELEQDLLKRYPHQVSGGQQQRAGLCRALMLNPEFLLLDEAFGAVDPITRVDIHRQFKQLQQLEQRTILLVTHDIREALLLADDIVTMHNGTIVNVKTANEYQACDDPEQTLLDQIRHAHA